MFTTVFPTPDNSIPDRRASRRDVPHQPAFPDGPLPGIPSPPSEEVREALILNRDDLRRTDWEIAQLEKFEKNGLGKGKLSYAWHNTALAVFSVASAGIALRCVQLAEAMKNGLPLEFNAVVSNLAVLDLRFAPVACAVVAGAAGAWAGSMMIRSALGIGYERVLARAAHRFSGRPLPVVERALEYLDRYPRKKGSGDVANLVRACIDEQIQHREVLEAEALVLENRGQPGGPTARPS